MGVGPGAPVFFSFRLPEAMRRSCAIAVNETSGTARDKHLAADRAQLANAGRHPYVHSKPYRPVPMQLSVFHSKQLQPLTQRAGFTLIELMVTIAVLAVILAIGIPSFSAIIQRNRLTTAANELVGTFQTAKMEAIRRNSRVVICPTTTGLACSGADNWSRVVVFVDANSNGAADGTTAEPVVRDVQVIRSGTSVTAQLGSTSAIRFGADGRARVGAAVVQGAVSIVSTKLPAAEATRRVQVSAGRVSVCNPSGTPICS